MAAKKKAKAKAKPRRKREATEIYLTQKDLGKWLSMDRTRVGQMQAQGILPPREDSRGSPLKASVIAYILYLNGKRDEGDEELFDYRKEAAREKHYKAEKAKLDAGERKKTLVQVADVVRAWSSILVVIRSRLLSLPRRLSKKLAKMSSVAKVRQVLTDEIKGLLIELASTSVEFEDPDDE